MISLMLAGLMSASASEVDLLVERARAALREERPLHARSLALQAIERDRESDGAWRMYVRGSQDAGLGPMVEAELADMSKDDAWVGVFWTWLQVREGALPPSAMAPLASQEPLGKVAHGWVLWTVDGDPQALDVLPRDPEDPLAARLRIRVAVETGDYRNAVTRARNWARAHPDQPDVLAELWADAPDPDALAREQRRTLKLADRELGLRRDEPLFLYRALRLFAAAKEHNTSRAIVERLGELGLEQPLHRTGWSDAMREGMGRVLALRSDGDLPEGTHRELLDITMARVDRLRRREEYDQAVNAWQALREVSDGPEAALEHAVLLQVLERPEEAWEVALQARGLAARPTPRDVGALDTAGQAAMLADVHGLLAELALTRGDVRAGRQAASIAQALEPQPRFAALLAQSALLPQGGVGLPADPLAQSVLDTLATPSDGEAWARRAREHEDVGDAQAAFVAWTVARAHGQSIGGALANNWDGLGDPQVAAQAALEAYHAARRDHRTRLADLRVQYGDGPGLGNTIVAPGAGLTLPTWEAVDVEGTPLGSEALEGEPYILAVWASWCLPCLQELPLLNRSVRLSEAEGKPVVAVAISVDEADSAFRRKSRQSGWDALRLGWNPQLSAVLGVDGLPTTFVIGGDGRVVEVSRGFKDEASVVQLVEAGSGLGLMGLGAWVTAPLLPALGLWTAADRRSRVDWRELWGLDVAPVQAGATWVVASSLGEVQAALGLLPHLQGPTLLTADTDTGAALARQHHHVACRRPHDHPWTLAPLWAEARPSRLIWVEGAWWPALYRLGRCHQLPQIRVNARPGRGTARLLRLGVAGERLIARSEEDAQWLRSRTRIPIDIGGELKLSAPRRSPFHWDPGFRVAGSTEPGDEHRILRGRRPGERWLIAPRRPERFDAVAAELDADGTRWIRRSALVGGTVPDGVDVVLLDSVGELAGCYAGAELAFVGGSFDPRRGAHSPAEALAAGVPIVCGPHLGSHGPLLRAHATVVEEMSVPAAALGAVRRTATTGLDPGVRTAALLGRSSPGPSTTTAPRPWARPASLAYGAGVRLRTLAYDHGLLPVTRLDLPVVSVGSANARSPGRSSTVAWLVRQLARRGHRPGVATRGFGRSATGLRCSWNTMDAGDLGDEGALMASAGVPVAACADRVRAARALQSHGVSVVVLDDGLQHRRLARDLDLVVIDGRQPEARGLLPMGEAREAAVPTRADGLIVHHGFPEGFATHLPAVIAERRPGPWMRGKHLSEKPVGPVFAFAGIGRPADFLASLDVEVGRFLPLGDHQPVDNMLWQRILVEADGRPIVCTAKDHARLSEEHRGEVWWRDLELEIQGAPEWWFERLERP